MTYLARLLKSSLFLVPLLAASCDSSPGLCPCPSGDAVIRVPGTVAQVTAPEHCSASTLGADAVFVGRDSAGSCQVRIQLTDGTTYTSLVQFTGGGGCCPYTNFGTAGPLELAEGGASGG